MNFNIDHVTNSSIGDVHTGLISGLINLFKEPLRDVVNLIFKNGIDIQKLLNEFGFKYIEFDRTYLQPEDGYFIFCVTLKFNLDGKQYLHLVPETLNLLKEQPTVLKHFTKHSQQTLDQIQKEI